MTKIGFSDNPVAVQGHKAGYVNALDVDRTNVIPEALHSVLNMELHDGYDERRKAYDVAFSLVSVLPSGYTIGNFYEKVFIDKDGTSKTCMIVLALKASKPAKIYINKFYNPATGYDNCHGGSPGWEESAWVELTESFTGAMGAISDPDNPIVTFEINDAALVATADYYNGFFAYRIESNSDITCIGMITDYSKTTTIGTFTIMRRSYPGTDGTVYPNRYIPEIANAETIILVRFPELIYLKDDLDEIADVTFEENFNSVTMATGHDIRPIWIGFISDRKAFIGGFYISDFTFTGSSTDDLGYSGSYFGESDADFEIEIVSSTNIFGIFHNVWKWKRTGGSFSANITMTGNWFTLEDGIRIRFSTPTLIHGVGDKWVIEITGSDAGARKWDGFYLDADGPDVLNKKVYKHFVQETSGAKYVNINEGDIGRELGIDFYFKLDSAVIDLHRIRIFSFAVTADGFQTVFVKNLVIRSVLSGANYEVMMQDPRINFNIDFNRRITGSKLFYVEEEPGAEQWYPNNKFDNVIKPTLWVDPERGGDVPLSGDSMIANEWDSNFNVNRFAPMYHEDGQFGFGDAQYIENFATGQILDGFLNHRYYNKTIIKPNSIIQVGNLMLGLNLSADSPSSENKTDVQHGGAKGAFSCVQRDYTVRTKSIFDSERIVDLAKENIVGGASTVAKQFLVFTENICRWYKIITDHDLSDMENIADFAMRGCISKRSIVSAVYVEKTEVGSTAFDFGGVQFGGVFWAGKDSIYAFYDNQPVDLLEGRWRKYYQTFSASVKQNIRGGWLNNSKFIYFVIDTTIWVFNRVEELWYIFSYPDTVINFHPAKNGELMFHDGTKIYTTLSEEDIRTAGAITKYLDKGTEAIQFNWKGYINGGDASFKKTPDRFDMLFEIETVISLGEPTAGNVKLSVGTDDSSTNILNQKTLTLQGKQGIREKFKTRKACNYYSYTVESDSATDQNIKFFRVKREVHNSKLRRGKISKI